MSFFDEPQGALRAPRRKLRPIRSINPQLAAQRSRAARMRVYFVALTVIGVALITFIVTGLNTSTPSVDSQAVEFADRLREVCGIEGIQQIEDMGSYVLVACKDGTIEGVDKPE